MISFQDYIFAAIVMISNAFCTGIGVTLGVYFTNRAFLKRQEQEVDTIVKKVLAEIEKREKEQALKDAPRYLQGEL
jgi:hypothetical protein